ncbi:hypothetical protein ABPG74_019760 [Tetrahymena malaccensis]
MGTCTSQSKNQRLVEKAKRAIEKEGYTILEIKDGKTTDKIIPNKVVIVSKDNQKYAFKIRYFQNELDNQGISAQVGILCDLKHPNFVHFQRHFIRNHMFFFLMDYYPVTLRSLLYENKSITQEQRYRYAFELIQGINFVHSQGHTHRELKTQNIMISPEDRIIICEFGLEFDSDIHKKKQETSNLSDKWYLAPEINQKTESIYYQQSKQTDIWAIGVIIAELFGFKYASALSSNEELERIKASLSSQDYAQCLSEMDQSVHSKVVQMLNLNPDKRGDIADYLPFFEEKYNQFKQGMHHSN